MGVDRGHGTIFIDNECGGGVRKDEYHLSKKDCCLGQLQDNLIAIRVVGIEGTFLCRFFVGLFFIFTLYFVGKVYFLVFHNFIFFIYYKNYFWTIFNEEKKSF